MIRAGVRVQVGGHRDEGNLLDGCEDERVGVVQAEVVGAAATRVMLLTSNPPGLMVMFSPSSSKKPLAAAT